MATYEQLFNSSVIEVVVPDASIDFPSPGANGDSWYAQLKGDLGERSTAFIDEQLEFVLVLRTSGEVDVSGEEVPRPPAELLSFLGHIQVTLEASYIQESATPGPSPLSPGPASVHLVAPPRTASLKAAPPGRNRPPNLHPSIFPPQTPHPTPSAGGGDRRYVRAEGTPLATKAWNDEDGDEFSLLWLNVDKTWMALFKMSVGVAFVRLDYEDPLLCLTVSTTLRNRMLDMTRGRKTIQRLLDAAGGVAPSRPPSPTHSISDSGDARRDLTSLAEVNLLEGLAAGPSFALEGPNAVTLPSTRLGTTTRRQAFSLAATSSGTPRSAGAAPPTAAPKTTQTLRRAFRKTLGTAAGFRVRMRTVFVPHVLGGSGAGDVDAPAAGSAESSVVLCVELENTGDASLGFAVARVDVDVSGDGARATMLGGSQLPVRLPPHAQHNLLYAVSFVRTAAAADGAPDDVQRAVAIFVHGRPYAPRAGGQFDIDADDAALHFPAREFASRWNCVLDLDPRRNRDSRDLTGLDISGGREVLPEPATPFPADSPHTATAGMFGTSTPGFGPPGAPPAKRHTVGAFAPGTPGSARRPSLQTAPMDYGSPKAMLNPLLAQERAAAIAGRRASEPAGAMPPSLALQQSLAAAGKNTTTTYAPASPTPTSTRPPALFPPPFSASIPQPPPTPAYPAYPNAPPSPAPPGATPMAGLGAGNGPTGPAIDIARWRGGFSNGVPPTPAPHVPTGLSINVNAALAASTWGAPASARGFSAVQKEAAYDGEPLVVSIGLLPRPRKRPSSATASGMDPTDGSDSDTESDSESPEHDVDERIFPLDRFTLDIFVFNRSSWTRRLEVSYPERRRRRQAAARRPQSESYFPGLPPPPAASADAKEEVPGILPLENRVRIGPLRPETCQSVRMGFVALSPGVHPLDALVLTDVESGFSVSLRSIMDIVVHDRLEA